MNLNNINASSLNEICELFEISFASTCTINTPNPSAHNNYSLNSPMGHNRLKELDVHTVLLNHKVSGGTVPDGIPLICLVKRVQFLYRPLKILFNLLLYCFVLLCWSVNK